jgi:signal peptidase I
MKYIYYDEDNQTKSRILTLIRSLVLVVAAAYCLTLFTCCRVQVDGQSMSPAIEHEDVLLVNRVAYTFLKPDRFDVISIKKAGDDQVLTKRVIGLPGETVEIKDGHVYINGDQIEDITEIAIISPGIAEKPVTLGKDEYFILGDNRNSSADSRSAGIGVIKSSEIYGKCWLIVSPLHDFGLVH